MTAATKPAVSLIHEQLHTTTAMATQTSTERPPEVENVRDYPELGRTGRPYVPARTLNTDYPVCDHHHHHPFNQMHPLTID